MNTRVEYSNRIKQEAKRLGFADCGIARLTLLNDESFQLKKWMETGMNGDMHYFGNNLEKRSNPQLLVPNAKSIVVVLMNYFTAANQKDADAPKISKYALGMDYHVVLKNRLKLLHKFINSTIKPTQGSYFVDSAPVFEKAWAARAGLGWIGNNTLLITEKYGSFVFIGVLIVDLELAYDNPVKNQCGSCTLCLETCPTKALKSPRLLDARDCISYQTIEVRTDVPLNFSKKLNNYMYGCDICQLACPWNKKVVEHTTNEFKPVNELLEMKKEDWKNLTEEKFNELFDYSAVKRAGYTCLMRNIEFIEKQ